MVNVPGPIGPKPEIDLLNRIMQATQRSQQGQDKIAAATLAAGMIAASGRAHSIKEAVELMHKLQLALNPAAGGSGRYNAMVNEGDLDRAHN